ncbi:MAG: prepilin-type N-terminal cleavage/methylation domain-containing protein, partial [Chthoniobacteraceae bacterium]
MKGATGHRFPRGDRQKRGRGGFTLLEVMIATLILSLTAVGMFRFVQSTIRAVSYSVEDTEEQLSVDRLAALVQEELHALPFRGQLTLQGEGVKLNGTDFDSMEWRSRGGPGLMTTAASG